MGQFESFSSSIDGFRAAKFQIIADEAILPLIERSKLGIRVIFKLVLCVVGIALFLSHDSWNTRSMFWNLTQL